MPPTVTVRVSVAFALILMTVGGGFYGFGIVESERAPEAESGIHIERVESTESSVVNLSSLTLDQRALVLLAQSSSGSYLTTDNHLQDVANDMPRAILVDGHVYEISPVHVDSIGVSGYQILGALTAVLGSFTLVAAGLATAFRRFRDEA